MKFYQRESEAYNKRDRNDVQQLPETIEEQATKIDGVMNCRNNQVWLTSTTPPRQVRRPEKCKESGDGCYEKSCGRSICLEAGTAESCHGQDIQIQTEVSICVEPPLRWQSRHWPARWVSCLMTGLKKEYRIYKNLKGTRFHPIHLV
jgi:hypothetical protein